MVLRVHCGAHNFAPAQARHTGRDDRATSEQVMDPRTRYVLLISMFVSVRMHHHTLENVLRDSGQPVTCGNINTCFTDNPCRVIVNGFHDPCHRLILFKLLNSGFIAKIDGCLSTGKEANVYYALAGGNGGSGGGVGGGDAGGAAAAKEYAIKVRPVHHLQSWQLL
jgi:serine/threonine-protein kinase RIO1